MKTCEGSGAQSPIKRKKKAQVIKIGEGFPAPLLLLLEDGGGYLKRFNIALANTVREQ